MTTEPFTISAAGNINHNASTGDLIELAIRRGEGRFASSGAFVVETGAHTGRSAQDKFTVRDASTETTIWWDNNKPLSAASFDSLYADFCARAIG